jgi:hypothetical protein
MTRKRKPNSSVAGAVTLPLKRATMKIDSQPGVAIGGVSLEFTGRRSRSGRLTFLSSSKKPFHRSGTIEFEISRVQAWDLAEWILQQSTRRVPRVEDLFGDSASLPALGRRSACRQSGVGSHLRTLPD